MEKLSKYSYGITGFSYCYNKDTKEIEENLLIMYYGGEKKFIFKKDKAYELICAINGKQNSSGSVYTKSSFEFELKFTDILTILNSRLLGRGFLMITKCKDLAEYDSNIQNSFVGITGLDLEGKIIAKSTTELFRDGFANENVDNYSKPPVDYKPERFFQA